MNKILVSNNGITSDNLDIEISKNKVIFNKDGEYVLEYIDDGKYSITFIVSNNVKLIERSFDKELVINNRYVIDGELKVIKFYNNLSVQENIDIDLCSEGAKVNYCFANICRMDEKYTININHKCKKTSSNIQNKGIALKNSIINYVINSYVGKECNDSLLEQNTRIVTMDECDAAISPNMFIDLDDVSAKHGSVIGSFNEDQIFYLMSKGISYYDTLKLLIKGYIMSIMEVDIDTRMKILEIIDMYWR